MNIEQIKEMIQLLEASGLQKLAFKDSKGFEIQLEKPSVTIHQPAYPQIAPMAQSSPHVVKEGVEKTIQGHYITSPMVGTVYLTPAPGEKAFVKVGDKVTENSIVCIVEAMKVMNEIKACVHGTIVEICVDNTRPVEFGTKLFRVQP